MGVKRRNNLKLWLICAATCWDYVYGLSRWDYSQLSETERKEQLLIFCLLSKNKIRLIKSPTCLSVSPTNNFLTDLWAFMKFGKQVMPLKRPRCHIFFNLVASASPKWWTFKFLRWVHRNPLISFGPIAGFGWSLVWRWWHWRWPQLHII
jgi:hypothetical protein